MFFKRSLVLTVGVLLFIGAFLLKFHLSEARLENTFKEGREKYGVEGAELTLQEAAPPAPIVPTVVAPAPAPAPATSDSSSTSSSSSSDSDAQSAAPGNTTDPNMLIGPAAPTPAAPAPSAPDTNAAPSSTPDTNGGGPMAPTPSTMTRAPSSLRMARLAARMAALALGQTNGSGAAMTLRTEDTNAAPKAEGGESSSTKAEAPAAKMEPAETAEAPEPAPPAGEHGGRAIILGYHQFTGPGIPSRNIYSMSQDVFESEMKYLRDNHYNVVPLSDVVAFVEHKKELPENAVAITIDDGYKSALNYAAPVLKKYGYTWTYFVYPSFITRTEGKGAASWPDLLELGREGIDVECHSETHPQLNKKFQDWPQGSHHAHMLSDAEYSAFLDNETVNAKAILEKELNKPIKYFAYPYGAYNSTVEAKVRAAGFEAVFTVAGNPIHITTLPYRMGRYIITKPVEKEFAAYLHQGALGLVEATPEPGAIVTDPKPVITAVLDFHGDPATLETDVRDFGTVKHDFDPGTSTLRLYLPHPLVQPDVVVNIRQKDPQTGVVKVANWEFNYEAAGSPAVVHPPIEPGPVVPAPTATESTHAPAKAPEPAATGTPTPATTAAASPAPATNATPAGP